MFTKAGINFKTVLQEYGDWYTGCTWVGCYILYSEEGPELAAAPPSRSPPRCTKCNSTPVNGQCTNFILLNIALQLPLHSKRLNLLLGRESVWCPLPVHHCPLEMCKQKFPNWCTDRERENYCHNIAKTNNNTNGECGRLRPKQEKIKNTNIR